mgnify:CR=1 FL=1
MMRPMQQTHPKIKSRISVLIKSAELIYRDVEKLHREDIIYYLLQIQTEVEDCLATLNYSEKEDKV